MNLRQLVRKYRLILLLEIIVLFISGAWLAVRKNHSYAVSPAELIFTQEAAADGYSSTPEDALLRISVPEEACLDEYDLCLFRTFVPSGIYEFRIDYSTVYDTSMENKPLVSFITFDEGGDISRFSDRAYLYDHMTLSSSRLYVPRGGETVYSMIRLCGNGDAVIDSVTITEYRPWKIMVFCGIFLFFVLADAFAFFMISASRSDRAVLCTLVIITAVSVYPLFASYSISGHDLAFHLHRVGSLAEEMMHGHFPVRYMSDAYYGHGYIIDVFYANIFLVPSALLYMLGAPLYAAYNSYLILACIITVISSYVSFKGMFGEKKWGIAGACIYTFSLYRLCDLYVRSDAGELTAMAFLPLIIYGLAQIYRSEKRDLSKCLPFIIGAFGVVQSHILSVILCIFFILLFCLVVLPVTVRKLPELLFSGAVLLVINAFYLVPVLSSFVGMGMSVGRAAVSGMSDAALEFVQIFEMPFGYGDIASAVHMPNEMHFGAGAAAVLGTVLFAVLSAYALIRKKKEILPQIKTGGICLILGLVAAFISSRAFPWDGVNKAGALGQVFTSMQFPWRFMEMADPLLCFTAVSGMVLLEKLIPEKKKPAAVIICIIAALSVASGVLFACDYDRMYAAERERQRDDAVAIRPDWTYFPEGLNRYLSQDTRAVADNIVRRLEGEAVMEEGVLSYEVLTSISDVKEFRIVNGRGECSIELPVFALDNVKVTDVLTGQELTYSRSAACKVSLQIPAGYDGNVRITYRVPVLWRIADLISLLGIAGYAAFCCRISCGEKSEKKDRSVI
ncbi:MAG: YfhO family protein [Lachnospiraceae bacterium]|nr:YfhO family protein [Lachnospiraceae bacterium]